MEEADKMASVGVDVCVAHMGLTTSGSIGAQTAMSLDDAVKLTSESEFSTALLVWDAQIDGA